MSFIDLAHYGRGRMLSELIGSPLIYMILHRNFVGGSDEDEALALCKKLNTRGLCPIVNLLGEEISTKEEACENVKRYMFLTKKAGILMTEGRIQHVGIAVKPSHIGVTFLNAQDFYSVARDIVFTAERAGVECTFDAEHNDTLARTYKTAFKLFRKGFSSVGACFQANEADNSSYFEDALTFGNRHFRVRIVKGGYPGSITRAQEINARFLHMVHRAVDAGCIVEIGTHDLMLLSECLRMCYEKALPKERVRIQMLYGVRMKLQTALANGERIHGLHGIKDEDLRNRTREALRFYGYKNMMPYVPCGGIMIAWRYLKRRMVEGMRPGLRWLFVRNIWESYWWRRKYVRYEK